jgi:hypothetical protein
MNIYISFFNTIDMLRTSLSYKYNKIIYQQKYSKYQYHYPHPIQFYYEINVNFA